MISKCSIVPVYSICIRIMFFNNEIKKYKNYTYLRYKSNENKEGKLLVKLRKELRVKFSSKI